MRFMIGTVTVRVSKIDYIGVGGRWCVNASDYDEANSVAPYARIIRTGFKTRKAAREWAESMAVPIGRIAKKANNGEV